ncbi:hypothetical protein DPMN_150621 [Dreissena polymorpha]|uniref:Uncharacterized protein n=1 Tax=Dreissena polymorpha TaxID=45954 RepID=A0A9D4J280_DREPO|nr:hypothetical protein DPMN_150621 [Dreissena polymorpha]
MEDFRRLLDINLVAYFGTIKCAIPHLRKTKGSVVNISSINGIMANQSTGFYNASKGGVTALTKSFAIDEVKNGVRVNSIFPGVIDTPMFQAVIQQQPPEFLHRWESISQMHRLGSPREIGLACLFLATDATFCTGVDLLCTGGRNSDSELK